MTAHQPDQIRAMQDAAADDGSARAPVRLRCELQALLDLSNQLAATAGLAEESFEQVFGESVGALVNEEWALEEEVIPLINDITAMLMPGICALETLRSRGAPPTAPALALWRELFCARVALIDTIARLARTRAKTD